MNIWIAISFLVLILFVAHLCTGIYQSWRCRASTRLSVGEKIIMEQDRVSMHIQIDSDISSELRAGLSFRGEGRLVLSEERLILGSTKGRLLEMTRDLPGNIRALGTRRLLLQGTHPTQKGMVRAELVIDNECKWAERSKPFSKN